MTVLSRLLSTLFRADDVPPKCTSGKCDTSSLLSAHRSLCLSWTITQRLTVEFGDFLGSVDLRTRNSVQFCPVYCEPSLLVFFSAACEMSHLTIITIFNVPMISVLVVRRQCR